MKKIPVAPWNELEENHRLALVESLLDDWPEMSREDREHVMFHDPDCVKAAGLWPGVEGDQALLSRVDEPAPPPKPAPPKPAWHELREDVRIALIHSLQKDWPNMSPVARERVMRDSPDKVKAAGLWPKDGQ